MDIFYVIATFVGMNIVSELHLIKKEGSEPTASDFIRMFVESVYIIGMILFIKFLLSFY